MAEVWREKNVKSGKGRTLESAWNASFGCRFTPTQGAQVKVRYGSGGWFGKDSQKKSLSVPNSVLRFNVKPNDLLVYYQAHALSLQVHKL